MQKGSAEFRKYQRDKNMEFEEKLQDLLGLEETEQPKRMPLEQVADLKLVRQPSMKDRAAYLEAQLLELREFVEQNNKLLDEKISSSLVEN